MRNDYEELLKQGYTEEEIQLMLDNVSRMTISGEPLGQGRDDRGVVVTDSAGVSRKTSSVMMGYNKEGIQLENGDYVSWEETEQVLKETLETVEEDVVYVCKKTGKVVEPAQIVETIFEETMKQSYFTQAPTDKITNQDASQVALHADGQTYPKGVEMLGNDKLQLPSGEYVSKFEITRALQDFVMLKEPEIVPFIPISGIDPIQPHTPVGSEFTTGNESRGMPPLIPTVPEQVTSNTTEPSKTEKHRVIERIKKAISVVPLLVAVAAEVLAGFGQKDVIDTQELIRKAQSLSYETSQVQSIDTRYETEEEVAKRNYEGITTGDTIYVDSAIPYYESSDYQYGGANRMGVVGTDLGYGDYELEGFSILDEGQIRRVEFNPGESLYSTMNAVTQETGKTIEELEPMVHMVKVGETDAGWISADDLISSKDKTPQIKDVNVVLNQNATYKGTIEDFQGDTITINNGKEDVTLKVKKDDGTFIEGGDIVMGSDGAQYQMTDLQVEQTDIIDIEEVKTGTKVNWSFKNITLEEHLAAAGIAVVGTAASIRRKKEMVEMTDEEINTLIEEKRKDFQKSKGEYEGYSEFKKATETLVGKQLVPPMTPQSTLREELIDQNITVEDIRNLGESGGKRR